MEGQSPALPAGHSGQPCERRGAAAIGPAVTIGIPTFNRPDGLDRTLASAAAQTFRDLEIVVSDNGSPDPRVREVVERHAVQEARLRVYWHPENRGICANGLFLPAQAHGRYFAWLADDDTWEETYLERLMARMTPETLLVFPDVTLVDAEGRATPNVLRPVYGACQTDFEYLRAWCGHGSGYPMCGLFNRDALFQAGISFEVECDLDYYQEGIFLHKLFLHGGVRFAPDANLVYSTASRRPERERLVRSYFDYTKRMTMLYLENQKLSAEQKNELLGGLLDKHCAYLKSLCGIEPPPAKKSLRKRLTRLVGAS